MKNLGIVRELDGLGRITLPMELRRTRGLTEGTPMDISVDGDKIVLQKYVDKNKCCAFCGGENDLFEFENRKICLPCAHRLWDKLTGKETV